jgi:hypothetical protein
MDNFFGISLGSSGGCSLRVICTASYHSHRNKEKHIKQPKSFGNSSKHDLPGELLSIYI